MRSSMASSSERTIAWMVYEKAMVVGDNNNFPWSGPSLLPSRVPHVVRHGHLTDCSLLSFHVLMSKR